MNCQNCNKKNSYGVKYCIYCGTKISSEVIDKAYSKTLWGRLQWLMNMWDKLLLKNITDNVVFKTIAMLVAVALMYFGFTGDLAKLRIAEGDAYEVTYNADKEEYEIVSDEKVIGLGLYVPKRTDKIIFCGYSGETMADVQTFIPEECSIVVEKGRFSHMTIETIHKGKVKDTIRFAY